MSGGPLPGRFPMHEPPYLTLRRDRLARRRRLDARGVSVILGALLVVVMVLAVAGMVVTKGVPAWMGQNEASYSEEAAGSLTALAATWEGQILHGGPSVLSNSIPLASAGVPLLASPTVARLAFTPSAVGVYENLTVTQGSTTLFRWNTSMSTLALVVPNRYATPETYLLQGEAVLGRPNGGAGSMLTDPLFSLFMNGSFVSFDATLLEIQGTAFSFSGPSEATLTSTLGQRANGWSNPSATQALTVTIGIGSFDACSWYHYLAQLPANAGLAASGYSLSPTSISQVGCRTPGAAPSSISLEIHGLASVNLQSAVIDLALNSGGG
jgi:hypothetical protein